MKAFFLSILTFTVVSVSFAAKDEGGIVWCPTIDGTPTNQKCLDVGCRPSPGECFNSCADHRAVWEQKADQCDRKSEVRCYCKIGR